MKVESTPLARPAVCLIIGITAGRFLSCSQDGMLVILLLLVVAAFLTKRSGNLQSAFIYLACTAAGCLLYIHQRQRFTVDWPGAKQTYEMVVVSEPVQRGKTIAVDALLTATGQKIQLRIATHPSQITTHQISIGDGLLVHTQLKPLSAQGSYRTFLESHDYVGEAFVWSSNWQRATVSLNGIGHLSRARLFFMEQRHKLLQHISANVREQDSYSILAAMTLGDKSTISSEQREQFSIAGTSHLLALSGLHLGIIYMLLTFLFRSRRMQLVNQLLIVSCIWAFVLMVGMSPSVVRAAVMISIYAFVSMLNRSKTPVNTLALTAIVMLVANPFALFDIGFQMSFCSVLAILLFVPLLSLSFASNSAKNNKPFNYIISKFLSFLWTTTTVSLAAQLGTGPLVAYYFGRFSVWFLLANYVAIPLTMLMLYSMLVVLLLSWWTTLQNLIIVVPTTIASMLNGWISIIASLPMASIDNLHPSLLQIAMLYVVIACIYYLLYYYVSHRTR